VGPLILGHADPDVVTAIEAAARDGTSFGASTEREVLLGEAIRAAVPSMERMRFVSSGTEAAMSALRVARGYTGRHRFIKVEGGYHGHADTLLAAAGSGVATLSLPHVEVDGVTQRGWKEGCVGLPLPGVAVKVTELETVALFVGDVRLTVGGVMSPLPALYS